MTIDLYTGPWRGPSNRSSVAPYKGPVAIALKRIVSRARPDLLKWQGFDDSYNRRLEKALAVLQRNHDIPGTGQTGEATFRMLMKLKRHGHPDELAADNVALNLLEDAWAKLHPPETPLHKVQTALADFLLEMETYSAIWDYLQRRAMESLGVKPQHGGRSDCSEENTAAPFFMRTATGVFVPDPNDRGFDGYGNTDTLYATNKTRIVRDGRYQIGDMPIYGPAYRTRHTTMCRQPGTASTAIFTSNGSMAGPLPTRVYYRDDLLAVVRPRLLPA